MVCAAAASTSTSSYSRQGLGPCDQALAKLITGVCSEWCHHCLATQSTAAAMFFRAQQADPWCPAYGNYNIVCPQAKCTAQSIAAKAKRTLR